MNICMLIPSFHPLVGGAETQLKNLTNYFNKVGINSWIVTRKVPNVDSMDTINGVPVIRLMSIKMFPIVFFINGIIYLIRKRYHFDILHIHSLDSISILGVLVGRLLKKPVILKVTGGHQLKVLENNYFRLWLIKRYASNFIALNSGISKTLNLIGVDNGRISNIPNGVNYDASIELGGKRQYNVVYCGRLINRKRVDCILIAWKKVLEYDNNIKLHIIGDGPEKQSLVNLSESLSLKDSVKFYGTCGQEKVFSILKRSKLFTLASNSEGISNSLLEAMSFGVVPIVSNVDGNIDVVEHDLNGKIFELGNSNHLALTIIELLKDRGLCKKIGSNALKRIKENYSIEVIGEMYMKLYENLLNKNENNYNISMR